MRTRSPKVRDACSWLVGPPGSGPSWSLTASQRVDDLIEQVGVEVSGPVREDGFVAGEGLERARREAPAEAPGVALGDLAGCQGRGHERHARQALREPHPRSGDRPGDAGVVGEPGPGVDGTVADEAAPLLELGQRRLERIERRPEPARSHSSSFSSASSSARGSTLRSSSRRSSIGGPFVAGRTRGARAPSTQRTGVRETVHQFASPVNRLGAGGGERLGRGPRSRRRGRPVHCWASGWSSGRAVSGGTRMGLRPTAGPPSVPRLRRAPPTSIRHRGSTTSVIDGDDISVPQSRQRYSAIGARCRRRPGTPDRP